MSIISARRHIRNRSAGRGGPSLGFTSREQKLSERYRTEFRTAGWEFGKSVINVVHCPCCPEGAKPDPEKVQTKSLIEEMLDGDEDGLAATFEDYQL